MFFMTIIQLVYFICNTKAVEIDQPITVFSYTGEKTALRCNHSIANFQSMYWYLQRPSKTPEVLIYGYISAEPKGRFSMVFYRDNRSTELHISNTEMADAVMYYCAVEPTVGKTVSASIQKHSEVFTAS
ncbi:immunoglobulin kappa light chain-like [Huso huso]